MNNQITIIVLRLIHILAGTFWVGATILAARFVFPALKAAGPSAAPVMRDLVQVRKLPVAMNFAGLFTILSGLALYGRMMMLSNGTWGHTASGQTFGLGALFGITVSIIGNAVQRPAGKRLGMLGVAIAAAGGPPTAEQRAELDGLQEKMRKSTNVNAVLLTLAVSAMAIARYL